VPDPLDAIRSTIFGDDDGDGATTAVVARTTGVDREAAFAVHVARAG
jgi:hypothetical protein